MSEAYEKYFCANCTNCKNKCSNKQIEIIYPHHAVKQCIVEKCLNYKRK